MTYNECIDFGILNLKSKQSTDFNWIIVHTYIFYCSEAHQLSIAATEFELMSRFPKVNRFQADNKTNWFNYAS